MGSVGEFDPRLALRIGAWVGVLSFMRLESSGLTPSHARPNRRWVSPGHRPVLQGLCFVSLLFLDRLVGDGPGKNKRLSPANFDLVVSNRMEYVVLLRLALLARSRPSLVCMFVGQWFQEKTEVKEVVSYEGLHSSTKHCT